MSALTVVYIALSSWLAWGCCVRTAFGEKVL